MSSTMLKCGLPRPKPLPRKPQNLDAFMRELRGACDLLAQAQDLSGDDRHLLLDTAADAWLAARKAGGMSVQFIDADVAAFEVDELANAGVQPATYAALAVVYLEKQLARTWSMLAELGQ